MTIIRRTLIVGLGSSGQLVAQQLKSNLQTQFNCLPFVSFFILDFGEPNDDHFAPSEEIRLSEHGLNEFVAQNAQIRARVPLDVNFNDAIQTRLGANVLFMKEIGRAQRTLDAAVRRLFDPAEWSEAVQRDFKPREEDKEVDVYIIASLAEPYGGGLLIDCVYLLQSLPSFKDAYTCSTTGILLTYSDQVNQSSANVYASLKELDYFMTKREYDNRHLNYHAKQQPFSRACHLVELKNEAGHSLRNASDGRGMIVEWLLQAIFQPSFDNDTINVRLEREGVDIQQSQHLPVYSSFGYGTLTMPWDAIMQQFAARFAGEMLQSCVLASPSRLEQKTNEMVESFWSEDEKLDQRSIVGLNPDVITESKISLSAQDQDRALRLFANMPEGGTALKNISLEDLRKRLVDEINLESDTYFKQYGQKVKEHLEVNLVPIVRQSINRKIGQIVSEPIGGLAAAASFLTGLRERLDKTTQGLQSLKESEEEKKAAAEHSKSPGALSRFANSTRKFADYFRETGQSPTNIYSVYPAVNAAANAALINRPRWGVTFQRILTILFETAIVIAILAYLTAKSIGDLSLLGLLHSLQLILALSTVIAVVLGLGLFCSFGKFLVDYFVGHRQANKHEVNIPAPIYLVAWIVVTAVATFLTMRLFSIAADTVSAKLSSLAQNVQASDFAQWAYLSLVAIGLLAILTYVAFFWLDRYNMRRWANEWRDAHDKRALREAFIFRLEIGIQFYRAAMSAADEHLQQINNWRSKLDHLRDDFIAKAKEIADSYNDRPAYEQPLTALVGGIQNVYSSQISDIANETKQFFHEPRQAFAAWLDTPTTQIEQRLRDYVKERFKDYWTTQNTAQLIAMDPQPTIEVLERQLGWLTSKGCWPYWEYYGRTVGTIKVAVGLWSLQEERSLVSAFRRLAGQMPNEPDFYDTGEKYALICVGFRYGIPVKLLASLRGFKKEYDSASGQIGTLHIYAGLVDELPDLIS